MPFLRYLIRRYQVLQEEARSVQVKFEAESTDDSAIESCVRDGLTRILPSNVAIEACQVYRIESPGAAKRRFVQSRSTSAVA
jgi:hypothetical protein